MYEESNGTVHESDNNESYKKRLSMSETDEEKIIPVTAASPQFY